MSNYKHCCNKNKNNNKKISVFEMYENAKHSCIDVGNFLCNLKRASWYIKLYKLFK